MNFSHSSYPGFILFILVLGVPLHLWSQNILTEMEHDAHHQYDRMIILSGGGDSSLHSSIQPYGEATW
jgi:hypothetical protein